MKLYQFFTVMILICPDTAFSDEHSFRKALRGLPPKYLGNIPYADRAAFIKELTKDRERMNVECNWLHWFSDGADIRGTSMIWAKELPRTNKTPLIFIHMAKPFAAGVAPKANQTFVMEYVGNEWIDVTKRTVPAQVDMKQHFRTRKVDTTIEVAQWDHMDRADHRGIFYNFGARVMDLRWDEKVFAIEKPKSAILTKN